MLYPQYFLALKFTAISQQQQLLQKQLKMESNNDNTTHFRPSLAQQVRQQLGLQANANSNNANAHNNNANGHAIHIDQPAEGNANANEQQGAANAQPPDGFNMRRSLWEGLL
jgi:hypothetical protein